VPGAVVRARRHLGKDVVLMPSFVNIGALRRRGHDGRYLGHGRFLRADRQARATCPAAPASVACSSRCRPRRPSSRTTASSARVRKWWKASWWSKGSVIGMGVFLGQSTRIYNRATGEISYGRVPPAAWWCRLAAGEADGRHSLYCAVIVKQVDAKTRSKTSVNELLRGCGRG
jgi:2,3,4,5-tetrahydropyridine-2-carboxylate N-succinyltransferase